MKKMQMSQVIAMYDVDVVAQICLCSSRHIRRLYDSGAMPRPFRVGRLVRWSKESIDQWIADGCPSCRQTRGGVR